MKTVSRIAKAAANILFWCVLVSLIMVTLITLFAGIGGSSGIVFGNFGFGRVITGSMEPDIPTGSFILIQKVDPADLTVGDVITFYSEDPTVPAGTPVSHAIVRIQTDQSGARTFITKGTANSIEDSYPVQDAAVIGQVVYSSVFLGKIIRLAQTTYIYPVLILLLIVSMLQSIVDVFKQIAALRRGDNTHS